MSKKQSRLGVCPKCVRVKYLTRHHVFPKRFFGKKNNRAVLLLCAKCHERIEQILPRYRGLSKVEYTEITKLWLRGGDPVVYPRRTKYEKVSRLSTF